MQLFSMKEMRSQGVQPNPPSHHSYYLTFEGHSSWQHLSYSEAQLRPAKAQVMTPMKLSKNRSAAAKARLAYTRIAPEILYCYVA